MDWDTREQARALALPDRVLIVTAAIAILAGVAFRLLLDWDSPLWVDEVWTGTIALQPTVAGLFRDMVREIGGPIYYTLIWLWVKIAGSSNVALRLPSLIFALLAPTIALSWRGPDWRVRLVWASVLLLWIPIFGYATEARSYSLAYLLGVVQVIAAHRLLERPCTGRLLAWSMVSAAAVLTHYHAALVVALQGMVYLACSPRAAFRTWPGLAPFVAPLAWFAWQWPLLARLSMGPVRWQPPMRIADLKGTPFVIIGGANRYATVVLVGMTVMTLIALWRHRRHFALTRVQPDLWIAATGLLATLLVYAMGYIRPSFAQRYLLPYAPAALFGVALLGDRWRSLSRWAPVASLLLFGAGFAIDIRSRLDGWQPNFRWFYNWQQSSEQIMARGGVSQVVFFLDNPVMRVADPDQLRRVAGFFFTRAHYPIETRAIVLAASAPAPNPTDALIAAADPAHHLGRTALIWIYDNRVQGSLAATQPPESEKLARWYRCDWRTHDRHIYLVTCLPR